MWETILWCNHRQLNLRRLPQNLRYPVSTRPQDHIYDSFDLFNYADNFHCITGDRSKHTSPTPSNGEMRPNCERIKIKYFIWANLNLSLDKKATRERRLSWMERVSDLRVQPFFLHCLACMVHAAYTFNPCELITFFCFFYIWQMSVEERKKNAIFQNANASLSTFIAVYESYLSTALATCSLC